ncbi:peptidoglycan-binding protein [Actinophytocola algeriensis]|uniref:Peptidoglycan hydrolase-like protein with peptidoglycan-binding domain n=1 Tax=Actinophytocola algeriensis TaxID=1768010 RepID=A0A7W7QDG1_9PSEU|nr:peptidoglycan-binding protein [Actinophytocola algeriensis]MBB4911612.1 peptidoglycan hydrolase-like protein with peptidoglycan-binding domain [Actinophytocola algeriensis]MBE1473400.1 peptidoglycan hydrolase-like protein with peptidoglycan-binding domain [Actinophytocola algeriensis]
MTDRLARRGFLTVVPAAAAAVVLVPRVAAASAGTADMELVVLAAQCDPVKTGTGLTPGAGPSVLLVEQALVDEGLLAAQYVDGHFGTVTRTAYGRWQESLGYEGAAANGFPGRASLTALAQGRFTLTRTLTPGSRTTFQGFPFNTRTVAMLREAQRLAGVSLVVEQGSYSPGNDPTSAGTHDGGGAVDLDAEALTAAQRTAVVTALRRVGFAAWLRRPDQGDWPLHIHGIAVNDTDLSTPAQKQVGQYYLGRNGLANNGQDDGPQVTKVTWEQYLRAA